MKPSSLSALLTMQKPVNDTTIDATPVAITNNAKSEWTVAVSSLLMVRE